MENLRFPPKPKKIMFSAKIKNSRFSLKPQHQVVPLKSPNHVFLRNNKIMFSNKITHYLFPQKLQNHCKITLLVKTKNHFYIKSTKNMFPTKTEKLPFTPFILFVKAIFSVKITILGFLVKI